MRKVLHEQLVEKMLIVLLPNEDVGIQVAAAQALAVLAESVICRDTIGQLGMYSDTIGQLGKYYLLLVTWLYFVRYHWSVGVWVGGRGSCTEKLYY